MAASAVDPRELCNEGAVVENPGVVGNGQSSNATSSKLPGRRSRVGKGSKIKRQDEFRMKKNQETQRALHERLGRELFDDLPECIAEVTLSAKSERQVKPRAVQIDTAPLAQMASIIVDTSAANVNRRGVALSVQGQKNILLKTSLIFLERQMSIARSKIPQCGMAPAMSYENAEFCRTAAHLPTALALFVNGVGSIQTRDEEYYPEYSNGDYGFNMRHHVRFSEIAAFKRDLVSAACDEDRQRLMRSPLWKFFGLDEKYARCMALEFADQQAAVMREVDFTCLESDIITTEQSIIYQQLIRELEHYVKGSVRKLALDGQGSGSQLVTVDRRYGQEDACSFRSRIASDELIVGGVLGFYTIWPDETSHHPLRHPDNMAVARRDFYEAIRVTLSCVRSADGLSYA